MAAGAYTEAQTRELSIHKADIYRPSAKAVTLMPLVPSRNIIPRARSAERNKKSRDLNWIPLMARGFSNMGQMAAYLSMCHLYQYEKPRAIYQIRYTDQNLGVYARQPKSIPTSESTTKKQRKTHTIGAVFALYLTSEI